MRALDLFPSNFTLDHDPGHQMSDDPASFIEGAAGDVIQALLQLPKVAIQVLISVFTDPLNFLTDLLGIFPNLDFSGIDFGGLLDWIDNVPFIGDVVQAITGVFGDLPDLAQFFLNFGSFLGGGVSFAGTGFNAVAAVESFVVNMLQPSNLLAWLDPISGLLPDTQAPQIITDIINNMESAFSGIPLVGPLIDSVFNSIEGLLNIGNNAQLSANTANSGVAALKAQINAGTSGASIIDSFDRAQATDLGPNWDMTYSSGSGTFGTDGNGHAHWTNTSSNSRSLIIRYSAASLMTNYQIGQIVVVKALPDFFVNPQYAICLRMNAAKDTYIRALIDHNTAEIGYVLSGLYTRLGATVGIDSSDGDLWELDCGNSSTGDGPYTFTLLQNNNTVLVRTDTAHASQLGPSYLSPGMEVHAGSTVIFGVSAQKGPPDLDVFTATDNSSIT